MVHCASRPGKMWQRSAQRLLLKLNLYPISSPCLRPTSFPPLYEGSHGTDLGKQLAFQHSISGPKVHGLLDVKSQAATWGECLQQKLRAVYSGLEMMAAQEAQVHKTLNTSEASFILNRPVSFLRIEGASLERTLPRYVVGTGTPAMNSRQGEQFDVCDTFSPVMAPSFCAQLSPAIFSSQESHSTLIRKLYFNRCCGWPRYCSSTVGNGEKESEKEKGNSQPRPKSIEDFQHEEIVGPTVERDLSAVANELRETFIELRTSIYKLARVLLAVGFVHSLWGVVNYFAMESHFSGILLTQALISVMLPLGLAYHLWQSVKPIDFFSKLEERSRLRILTLSLQITKSLRTFFQRGYGVGVVVSFALTLHLLTCVKDLLLSLQKGGT